MKPLWSTVLIARNEEKTLPRLMESLKEFRERGGEICLLDTGSTDKTVEVARSYGCRVEEVGEKFLIKLDEESANAINQRFVVPGEEPIVKDGDKNFDYSSARNYIAEFASNDMIATPDCDEIYTKLDIDKINAEIQIGAEQFEYQFVFAHDAFGNPAVQFLHSKFYNRKKLKWVGIIHEVLQGEARRKYLDESNIKLEHYQNVETNRSHYLTGLAIDCFQNPENDRNSHYFARELMYKGRFLSAIREFERHIAMNRWPTERAQSIIFVGDCYFYLGNMDESYKWYIKAFELEPNRREPLMKLAEHFNRLNKPAQAVAFAEAALTIPGISYYANHQPYYEYVPYEILYWGYWYLGKKEKSKENFLKAFSYNPRNPKYIQDQVFYNELPGDLPFTGERVVPDKMAHRPDILREHIARYQFASKFTKGKEVLDASCGTGYASDILGAKVYYGVDISEEAVAYAKLHYKGFFEVMDLEKTPTLGNKYDVVVSFETIEHLADPKPFLEWVKTHANIFVFSIPINMPSEFHKVVYSVKDIQELISGAFPNSITKYYGQNDMDITGVSPNSKYIVGVVIPHFPKISVVIPQLGREEGLKRCLDSLKSMAYPQDLIEVHVIEGEDTVPKKVAEGLKKSTGDYIVYGANDVEFTPHCFIEAVQDAILLDKGLVSFNEGPVYPDEGNICAHFMIKRSLIDEIGGEIFDTDFHHVGCDNFLWAKCDKLGQAYHSESAKIIHYHFSDARTPMDDVYKKGWSHVEEDRALLDKKLKEL